MKVVKEQKPQQSRVINSGEYICGSSKKRGHGLIQMYSTFAEDGNIYNISNTGKFICGLKYPNHELYLHNHAEIKNNEHSLLTFEKVADKRFLRLKSNTGIYRQVVPKWKKQEFSGEKKYNSSIFSDKNIKYYKNINSIRCSVETLKKYFVQQEFKWSLSNHKFEPLYKQMHELYYCLNNILYSISHDHNSSNNYNTLIEKLRLLKDSVEIISNTPIIPTVFDNVSESYDFHEVSDIIMNELKVIESNLTNLKTDNIKIEHLGLLTSEGFLYEQTISNEIKLPRGCDLVAALFGDYTNQLESQMLNYIVGGDDSRHHYATIIGQDFSDYITIEGFAKKGYLGLDNTWEYFMHGNFGTSIEDAFSRYTNIRYEYFDANKSKMGGKTEIVKTNTYTSTITEVMKKLTTTPYSIN